ncbi:MAG: ABC transporter permease [Cypionkella sp.]
MLYGLKFALRYLTASKGQTALLLAGVAVGVFVFIFISALIGGLAEFLVQRTVGNVAHVVIEAPGRDPKSLLPLSAGLDLMVVEKASPSATQLRTADAYLPIIAAVPGVRVTAQEIVGNGFMVRGSFTAPVAVTGFEPENVSAIANLGASLVAGSTQLENGSVLIGASLARDLDLVVGQSVKLRSARGLEQRFILAGIFEIGIDALDRRAAFITLSAARNLFQQPQSISRIEIKLDDLYQADAVATHITAITGLKATPWTQGNAQLLSGLAAQASSGNLIKGFSLVTIVIGIASALLLSTYRRRPEIGIMRAMGASRRFVVFVFVTQGTLIGLAGGLIGAGLGYACLLPFPLPEAAATTSLPVDVRQGAYGLAILLTTLGAILASILPARSAARLDPVLAIGQ